MTDTTSTSQSPISILHMPSRNVGIADRAEATVFQISAVFDHLRPGLGLPPAESIEVVIAADIDEAIRTYEGQVIGVESLEEFDGNRVGGSVVGKTMFHDEEHERVTILMDASIYESDDGKSQAFAVYLTAHEFAHSLLGQLRSAASPPMESPFLPWLVSRWLVRFALEEYVADALAEAVLTVMAKATDEDGVNVPVSGRVIAPRGSEYVVAAHERLVEIAKAIHAYRLNADLDAMWSFVQQSTSQVLVALAHAQSEEDHAAGSDDAGFVTLQTGVEFGPMHDLWASLTALLREFRLLRPSDEFGDAEQRLLEAGSDMVLRFWEAIGLTFAPSGDAFYIEVAPPSDSWSPD